MNTYLIKEETLTDIADAIREQTGDDEPIQVSDFASEIENISGGGDLDWSVIGYSERPQTIDDDYNYSIYLKNTWDGSSLAYNKNIVYLPLMDFSNITNAQSFFSECTYLQTVPNITMQPTTMRYLFSGCINLQLVDFSNFNASNTARMDGMFSGCAKLKELDLSSFYTPSLNRTPSMFADCTSLEKIDMRNFVFSGVTNFSGMFSNVPNNCLIIVKDNEQKAWINTNFSNLTNVKTVEEYEGN